MSSSLSGLVDNLSEGLCSDRCTDCKFCLDYMTTKDEQLISILMNTWIVRKDLMKLHCLIKKFFIVA